MWELITSIYYRTKVHLTKEGEIRNKSFNKIDNNNNNDYVTERESESDLTLPSDVEPWGHEKFTRRTESEGSVTLMSVQGDMDRLKN